MKPGIIAFSCRFLRNARNIHDLDQYYDVFSAILKLPMKGATDGGKPRIYLESLH